MKIEGQFSDLNDIDAATAIAFLEAFSVIEMTSPSPTQGASPTKNIKLSPTKAKRSSTWFAMAASIALVIAIGTSLSPIGSTVAWANEPTLASEQDVKQASAACGAVIHRGLGDLQFTGSTNTNSGQISGTSDKSDQLVQPTELPPLAVLDVRGDGALAVYQNNDWNVFCLLKREDNVWKDQGLSVSSAVPQPQPGALFVSQTSWIGGEPVSIVSGATPGETSSVTFKLSNGQTVTASVLNDHFAAWYPGDTSLVTESLRFH